MDGTDRPVLWERRLRSWSGLILAAYVIPHLVNHGLGLLSLDAMEAMRRGMGALWGNTIGGIVLFGAFLLHFGLGLWTLYRRAHLRMPAWEAAQIILGLLIWPLLMGHAIGTRLTTTLIDVEVTFTQVVAVLWLGPWWYAPKQMALIVVVFGHLAVGLHYWLRLKDWYARALPVLYPMAILLPVLSLLGFSRAGVAVGRRAADDPGWFPELMAARNAAPPDLLAFLGGLEVQLLMVVMGLIALTLIARLARRLYRNRHGSYRLLLPGDRTIRAPVGQSILEALRGAGIDHAAVCGGRGRCTTCRVRIAAGAGDLLPPEVVERRALGRIEAPPGVRLACQTRPRRDVSAIPLLSPGMALQQRNRRGGVNGQELTVVILFADLRGSTRLGERKLPYDVLMLLNQFFAEMSTALEDTGGHYAQFNGDGLMALYGLRSDLDAAARAALDGAATMLRRLDGLNERLRDELDEPLRMGIGIHCGEAIVGTMGPPTSPLLTAIGDNVNIAARLEAMTKEMGCPVVVSSPVADAAGLDVSGLATQQVAIRGRDQPIAVHALEESDISGRTDPVAA